MIAPLAYATVVCALAGAVAKHRFSLVFHFCFGKSGPPKGEKARVNGSQAYLRSSAKTDPGFAGLREDSLDEGHVPYKVTAMRAKERSGRETAGTEAAPLSENFSAARSRRGGALLPVRPHEPDNGGQQNHLYP